MKNYMGMGVAIGIAMGAGLGVALHNIALGVGIGVACWNSLWHSLRLSQTEPKFKVANYRALLAVAKGYRDGPLAKAQRRLRQRDGAAFASAGRLQPDEAWVTVIQ